MKIPQTLERYRNLQQEVLVQEVFQGLTQP